MINKISQKQIKALKSAKNKLYHGNSKLTPKEYEEYQDLVNLITILEENYLIIKF